MVPLEGYQDEIYLNGLGGTVPSLPTDLNRLEELARAQMPPQAFGYIYGGAGSGDTVRENAAAFGRWRIVPQMLTDVSAPSYASEVLGTTLTVPMLLGPIGVLKLAHPDGELAAARAAAGLDVPMVLSTASSVSMEEVAELGGRRWYQLYWPKDRDVAASLLSRAKAAGFTVLVVTLDTRLLGWRPHDLDAAFLPFLRGIGVQNYFSRILRRSAGRGWHCPPAEDQDAAVLRWASMFGDPSLTWNDLPFLRENWDGPVVLKGICSVADAQRAVDAGVDGIVVSNHGEPSGRRVRSARSTRCVRS